MPLRRCSWTNCPQLIPAGQRYCPTHTHTHEQQRGNSTQRGYNSTHQAERTRWKNLISNGLKPTCPRCKQPITPNQQWDLGHNNTRTDWTGPEHSTCNRRAGAINSNHMREHWT